MHRTRALTVISPSSGEVLCAAVMRLEHYTIPLGLTAGYSSVGVSNRPGYFEMNEGKQLLPDYGHNVVLSSAPTTCQQ